MASAFHVDKLVGFNLEEDLVVEVDCFQCHEIGFLDMEESLSFNVQISDNIDSIVLLNYFKNVFLTYFINLT